MGGRLKPGHDEKRWFEPNGIDATRSFGALAFARSLGIQVHSAGTPRRFDQDAPNGN